MKHRFLALSLTAAMLCQMFTLGALASRSTAERANDQSPVSGVLAVESQQKYYQKHPTILSVENLVPGLAVSDANKSDLGYDRYSADTGSNGRAEDLCPAYWAYLLQNGYKQVIVHQKPNLTGCQDLEYVVLDPSGKYLMKFDAGVGDSPFFGISIYDYQKKSYESYSRFPGVPDYEKVTKQKLESQDGNTYLYLNENLEKYAPVLVDSGFVYTGGMGSVLHEYKKGNQVVSLYTEASLATTKNFGTKVSITQGDMKTSRFQTINTYAPGQFSDVKASDWYSPNVAKAYELGLMKGSNATTFNPLGNLSVGETVALAARIHSIYSNGSENFAASTPWYQVYADYAVEHGILSSTNHDYARVVGRSEFAILLAKALPPVALPAINSIPDGAIPDVPQNADYASAVYRLYRAGILTGNDGKGTFTPGNSIDRSSTAAIVARMADPALRKTISLSNQSVSVTKITLDATSAALLAGESKTLTATVAPENATNKTVTWKTSKPSVATVENGTITAVGAGEATITATASSGVMATVLVKVSGRDTKMYAAHPGVPDFEAFSGIKLYMELGGVYGYSAAGKTAKTLTDYNELLKANGFTYVSSTSNETGTIDEFYNAAIKYTVATSLSTKDGSSFFLITVLKDSGGDATASAECYPGTNYKTFTAVTGSKLKEAIPVSGAVVYFYPFVGESGGKKSNDIQYIEYLVENGFEFYGEIQSDPSTLMITVYLNKGSELFGIYIDMSSYELHIIPPQ